MQALICTALGLPPTFFRRLLQSNGATSVLDFLPPLGRSPGGAPRLVVDRLNQARPRGLIGSSVPTLPTRRRSKPSLRE